MRLINFQRGMRLLCILAILPNILFGTVNAVMGQASALVSFGAVLFLAGVITFQTFVIRKLEKQEGSRGSLPVALLRTVTGRKRPDYARIREMEMECGLIDRVAEANAEWRALGSPDARIPGMTPLRVIRVEPKVAGRKPKRSDFSEDRAAMRALAETYRPENLPRTRRDDD